MFGQAAGGQGSGAKPDAEAPIRQRKRARFASAVVTSEDFALMETPHPYGVLPGGNRFFLDTKRAETLSPTRLLTDDCWTHVLGFCSGFDLAGLVQSCRFFYVAGHQPELWRDLVLRRQAKSNIRVAGPSWKDTFVMLHRGDASSQATHVPLAVGGVYSDTYYRLHSCRSFSIPDVWKDVESGSVPRVPVEEMTVDAFAVFESSNRPVVVTGAALTWKAFKKWQDPSYLLEQTSGRTFRATSGAAPLPANFTLEAYFDYCKSPHLEEAPLYLFDRTALSPGSPLWKDYMPDLQRACPYWDPERVDTGHDLFNLLGEGRRPDHTWLILGPKRSGSVFHIDPNATHAWNAAICGRKRWIFYPPGVSPPGVHPSEDGDEVALPLSLGEWLFQFWDEHSVRMKTAPVNERPLECTVEPGDVVFVPHGWWHLVVNLDEVNIAITHNYAGVSNLPNILKFLDQKRDQVSGCRDRDESIKPDELYEEFVKVMRQRAPDWLEQALEERRWTCRAWKDHSQQESTVEASASCSLTLKKPSPGTGTTSVMAKANPSEGGFTFSFL